MVHHTAVNTTTTHRNATEGAAKPVANGGATATTARGIIFPRRHGVQELSPQTLDTSHRLISRREHDGIGEAKITTETRH